jgi:putative ABC transport system permease protein
MQKRRWLTHIVLRALAHRRGRTALLLAVLTMASSLATALGIVSASMGKRVAEETRKYGANLVIVPESARTEVGSGALRFGQIGEPAFLGQREVEGALVRSKLRAEHSFHLRSVLSLKGSEIPVEGVDFVKVRALFPWWQVRGSWPAAGEALVGADLAGRLKVKVGDTLEVAGANGVLKVRIAGVLATGGDEDNLLFVSLPELQQAIGRPAQATLVRLLVAAGGESLKQQAASLQPLLPGALVKEVRQVARTSEDLLAKVKLLMMLVTAVVLICAGSSVAGTMSATVLERGKEIGLLKAMGGSRWDLLKIFSAEAVMLGVLGGLVGYLCGAVIAQFVTRTVFSASADLMPAFLVVSLGVSLLLALLGSLGPLLSVFKLDPVRSLRGE